MERRSPLTTRGFRPGCCARKRRKRRIDLIPAPKAFTCAVQRKPKAHHEGLEAWVALAHMPQRAVDLAEIKAALGKVLAEERDIGAIDDAAEGAVRVQPPLEGLEVVRLPLLRVYIHTWWRNRLGNVEQFPQQRQQAAACVQLSQSQLQAVSIVSNVSRTVPQDGKASGVWTVGTRLL